MSTLRDLDAVYDFLCDQLAEAEKHKSDYDIGRATGLRSAIDLIGKVENADIAKLRVNVLVRVAFRVSMLLLIPASW